VLFNIFINDPLTGMECTISKFAYYTKLGECLKGREDLQRDMDRLESWTITSHKKMNKKKYQILHLGCSNPGYTYKVGDERLESSPAKRKMGVWVDDKLNMRLKVCPDSQNDQPCPGMHQAQHNYLFKGDDCPTLQCTSTSPSWVLCVVLGASM